MAGRTNEIIGCLRGLRLIARASFELQESWVRYTLRNSSLKNVGAQYIDETWRCVSNNKLPSGGKVLESVLDSGDRLYTVVDGVSEYVSQSSTKGPQVITRKTRASPTIQQSEVKYPSNIKSEDFEIKLSSSDRELLRKLDMEHKKRLEAKIKTEESDLSAKSLQEKTKLKEIKTHKKKLEESLPSSAREKRVPTSRAARTFHFLDLATKMAIGTAFQYVKVQMGLQDPKTSLILTKDNMDKLVNTLCTVRGAALKLGQLLSIQDESIISPELAEVLQRVRKSADYMPRWQLDRVMSSQFGKDWRQKLAEFDERPFAAASIGQVHRGKLHDGTEVATKVQYPGVAKGINSDIDNLVGIMKIWNVFPKGMFMDNVVAVARRELAWEVDYVREAQCTKKFRELMKSHPEFYVPKVIDNLCTGEVFTSELVNGIPLEKCVYLNPDERKYIANKILELCLLELMEFRYMQTDPNWANFLFNINTKQIVLLDFGASREYPKSFVDKYIKIIKAAAENDRGKVLTMSQKIGMLTGYESKMMEEAHIDAVMILGETFRTDEFHFKGQNTIARIQNLVPTMINHRLTPPPEEIYSLHRKLSGIFLLCAKLDTTVSARETFLRMYDNYEFGDDDDEN